MKNSLFILPAILSSLFLLTMGNSFLFSQDIKDLESQLKSSQGKERIVLLLKIAEITIKTNPAKAVTYGNEILQLLEKSPDPKLELSTLGLLFKGYALSGDFTNSLVYGEKKLLKLDKKSNPLEFAKTLNTVSQVSIRQGNYDKARAYSFQALDIFEKNNDKKVYIASTLNDIGISYDMQGDYGKAVDYYLQSLRIKEELGDKSMIAASLNNIGVVYKLMNRNNEAMQYYRRALKINEELGDRPRVASLLTNIGNIYLDMKQLDTALDYYRKSLTIDKEINNLSGIASTNFNIGYIYRNKKEPDQALKYYLESLSIREKIGEKYSIAQTVVELGGLYCDMKRYSESIPFIERGMKIASEIGVLDVLDNAYLGLSSAYEMMADFRKALNYYKKHEETAKKLFNEESRKKFDEMRFQYEKEKKEKEITILKKNNEIQQYKLSRQRLIWYVSIATFIIFIIIGIQLFLKYRYVFAFWKKKHFIGHYKIVNKMATGGMGTIYKAVDITDSTHRTIAVKVLREEFFDDDVHKRRFKQEAAIIDQLIHPNIVRVIERGESDGNLYIAMELLEGPTLSEIIHGDNEGRLIPIDIALNIMLQIADVLRSIHTMNIIHRDLKPENIVLIQKGDTPYFVKLLDFGLATSMTMSRLTQTGMVIGTLSYLAPEQVSGGHITPASDIHSLGVIYYEMLTGKRPFSGENTLELMKRILNEDPEPPSRFREMDRSLNDLVMFMLKKNPEYRPRIEMVYTVLRELTLYLQEGSAKLD